MDIKKIFKKAIEKAVLNGYRYSNWTEEDIHVEYTPITGGFFIELLSKGRRAPAVINNIIFSHSFAKAFWGDRWQINLMEMVLLEDEEDRVKFLEQFIIDNHKEKVNMV